jgi:hypothetical protein
VPARRAGIVPDVRTPGTRALDGIVWVLFGALFVGAALLVKVAAVLLVVLVVLAIGLGLVLRVLRRRRPARPGRAGARGPGSRGDTPR